jgi:hypothetical protein
MLDERRYTTEAKEKKKILIINDIIIHNFTNNTGGDCVLGHKQSTKNDR